VYRAWARGIGQLGPQLLMDPNKQQVEGLGYSRGAERTTIWLAIDE
jgi:hypothetical protein